MKNSNEMIKGYAAVVCTAILWSLGGLFIKLVPWSALSINAARCAIALLVKIAFRRNLKIHFTKSVVLAGICFAGTATFFVLGNKFTTSANAILLQYSAPIFIILATWLETKRRPRAVDLVACFFIVGGICLCFLDNLSAGGMLGNIFALIAGFFFGMMLFLNAKPDASPDDANMVGFLLSMLVGLPFLVQETQFSLPILGSLAVLGAFQLGLAYILLEYGIRRVNALSVTFLSALEPILNPVWVAVFYGEKMGLFAYLGGGLVLVTSVLYSAYTARRASRPMQ